MRTNIPEGRQCNHPCCGALCRRIAKPKKVYQLKRTPIKKKPYRIKPVSEKRKGQLVLYKEKRAAFLSENKTCTAQLDGCKLKATDIHHAAGRENDLLNDMSFWVALCRNCHRKITDDTQLGIEIGVSVSRHKKQ